MITEDVRKLVADNTNYFHRSTDSQEHSALVILDTHCTRDKFLMRLKATKFHLDRSGNQRQYTASKCQMPPSNFAMPRESDSIQNRKGANGI